VRSTTETHATGTRNAMPVNLPFNSGKQSPTAFAAPVEEGITFCRAPRPPLQSFLDGPSTVGCDAVMACTVVMSPSSMPKLSSSTLQISAKQLVVHEAFDTIVSVLGLKFFSFTPITRVGTPSFAGAVMITYLAPAMRCF